MTKNEKITRELGEAAELMDASVATSVDTQHRNQREKQLQNWDEEKARKLAGEEDIQLDDEHFQVLHYLREHYVKEGFPQSGREIGDMLAEKFANQGGRKFLHRLFPEGPVTQGMRIAGLPVPAHSEDEGFGTAR